MHIPKKYIITVKSSEPPDIRLGQNIVGAEVVALECEDVGLVSASMLAERYGLSAEVIRRRLSAINQGTKHKHLFDLAQADAMMKEKPRRRGRKRIN